jgi:hypothetical protein
MTTIETRVNPVFEALSATEPTPDYPEKMMLYGQFVGAWVFDWAAYDLDGTELLATRGEWLFTWALEGRAVQDVWICPARDIRETDEAPAAKGEYGTTLRFFDPAIDMWRVVWIGPGYGNIRVFTAYASGDEIVQETAFPQGEPVRWVFSEISDGSFSWRGEKLHGGVWRVTERMRVRRR